jgi:DNA-binding transcriptional MerR regulator
MPTALRTVSPPRIYRIDDLMEVGFSRYQIHRLVHLGVLPHAHGRGPTAYYTDEHVNRLKAIARERDQRCTLADFAERFSRTSTRTRVSA